MKRYSKNGLIDSNKISRAERVSTVAVLGFLRLAIEINYVSVNKLTRRRRLEAPIAVRTSRILLSSLK